MSVTHNIGPLEIDEIISKILSFCSKFEDYSALSMTNKRIYNISENHDLQDHMTNLIRSYQPFVDCEWLILHKYVYDSLSKTDIQDRYNLYDRLIVRVGQYTNNTHILEEIARLMISGSNPYIRHDIDTGCELLISVIVNNPFEHLDALLIIQKLKIGLDAKFFDSCRDSVINFQKAVSIFTAYMKMRQRKNQRYMRITKKHLDKRTSANRNRYKNRVGKITKRGLNK